MSTHISVRALRQEYPNINILTFGKIYDAVGHNPSQVRKVLEGADRAARKRNRRVERVLHSKLEGIRAKIRSTQKHHQLDIAVPNWVDLEHTQAILAYGYLMFNNQRVFAGFKHLPDSKVRVNVESRLGKTFDLKKFRLAFTFLVYAGAILTVKKGSSGLEASSFNPHEKASGVTAEGRDIIIAVKRLMYNS